MNPAPSNPSTIDSPDIFRGPIAGLLRRGTHDWDTIDVRYVGLAGLMLQHCTSRRFLVDPCRRCAYGPECGLENRVVLESLEPKGNQ